MAARRGEPRALLDSVLHMPSWPEGCIDWPFGRGKHGYGMLRVANTTRAVHVIVCEHRHGPRPDGMEARHLCGRGAAGCFNPQHLEWATTTVNQRDRLPHGTHTRGERHGMHKLTEADVLAIRRMYVGRGGPTLQSIADQFGISATQVCGITRGREWSWL